jgi:predicted PurR-regulated permease PerM
LVGNIHPLITIVGILYGVPIFGILGLVIGPLLFSYFLLLFRLYFNYEAEVVVQADDEA